MFMKNIDVIIFVEHQDRELTVSKLLKEEMEKLNLSVIIASIMFEAPGILFKYRPKAIVTPYIGFGKNSISEFFSRYYGTTINYYNLNYEQILFPFTGSFKIPKNGMAKNHQINFCWGENFKTFLNSHGVPESNLFISGRPYSATISVKNKNRAVIRDSIFSINNLDKSKKLIFIALTDSLALSPYSKVERIVKKDGDYDALHRQIQWDKNTINQLLRIIEQTAQEKFYSQFNFVLRPHPTLDVRDYRRLINDLGITLPENFKIIKNGDAISWLIASDYFITNYSTLILDAIEINKPVFTINSNDTKTIDYLWLVNHNDCSFNDIKELTYLLSQEKEKVLQRVNSSWLRDLNAIEEIAKVVKSQVQLLNNYPVKIKLTPSLIPYLIRQKLYKFWLKNYNQKIPLIKESQAVDYFEIIE